MTYKYVLCLAVLIAAIEAYPRPKYVVIPKEEYEALVNAHGESDAPLSRHKRSSYDEFAPSHGPYRNPYAPRRQYYSQPQYTQQVPASSNRKEMYLKPNRISTERINNGGYRRRIQQSEPSVLEEVRVKPERISVKPERISVQPERISVDPPYKIGYKQQQNRPRITQSDISQFNEIREEPEQLPFVRPFTGGFDGTPQDQEYLFVKEDPQNRPHSQNRPRPQNRPHPQFRPDLSVDEEDDLFREEEAPSDLDQDTAGTHEAPHHGGGDDHVDYGAYTGSYGAFGWYSDHPVLVYRRR